MRVARTCAQTEIGDVNVVKGAPHAHQQVAECAEQQWCRMRTQQGLAHAEDGIAHAPVARRPQPRVHKQMMQAVHQPERVNVALAGHPRHQRQVVWQVLEQLGVGADNHGVVERRQQSGGCIGRVGWCNAADVVEHVGNELGVFQRRLQDSLVQLLRAFSAQCAGMARPRLCKVVARKEGRVAVYGLEERRRLHRVRSATIIGCTSRCTHRTDGM